MPVADELYEKLTNAEDARVCEDISDEACRETPTSFVLLLVSYFLTKVGDAIASPKTTLAPLISNAGVIGLLALMGLAGAALGMTLPKT